MVSELGAQLGNLRRTRAVGGCGLLDFEPLYDHYEHDDDDISEPSSHRQNGMIGFYSMIQREMGNLGFVRQLAYNCNVITHQGH